MVFLASDEVMLKVYEGNRQQITNQTVGDNDGSEVSWIPWLQ